MKDKDVPLSQHIPKTSLRRTGVSLVSWYFHQLQVLITFTTYLLQQFSTNEIMVSRKTAGADKHHNMSAAVTGGGSAFNQVPSINASSYDKESSHMMGINTVQTSSQSSGVFKYPPGADVTTVPNYTVHTGRANNHNDKSNSNSHSRNPSPSEKQTLLHVRQNFGKDHGYLPPIPTTKNSRSSSKQQHHHMTMEEVRGGVANEMPFDFLNHTVVRDRSFDGPGSNKKLPSVNSMDGVVGSNGAGRDDIFCGGIVDELDPDQGRFTIPPLRVSNPSAFQNEETYNVRKSHHETNNRKQQNNSAPTLTADCEEPRSSATPILNNIAAQGSGSVSRKKPPHDNGDDSVFDFVEDVSLLQNPSNNNKATVKVTHKMRRRKDRTRASPSLKVQQQLGAPHHLDDEDETVGDNTSLEDDAVHPAIKRPSPATLQERAAEAWKVRRAARTSSLRAKDKPGGANKSSNVSFVESDTVHHFEPTVESLSENDTANYVDEDETTLDMDGRSLNSEYTKTLESEVEDMIKDILFIGNGKSSIPGRRKLRDKPEIKRRLRQKKHMMMQDMGSTRDTTTQDSEISNSNPSGIGMVPQEATDYDDTQDDSLRGSSTNTFTDPSRSIPRTRGLDDEGNTTGTNSTAVRPVQDGSDPFLAIWGLVEGGVAAVSYALGLDDEPTDGEKKKNQKGGSSRHCIPQLAMHQTPRSGVQQGSGDFSDVLFGEGTCAGAIAQGPYGQYTSSKPEVHQDLHWYNEIEGGSESVSDVLSFDYLCYSWSR